VIGPAYQTCTYLAAPSHAERRSSDVVGITPAALCHMQSLLADVDHPKSHTAPSGAATHGAGPTTTGPTATDSEEPPSWGTWATDRR
jgi:hypothetical protein